MRLLHKDLGFSFELRENEWGLLVIEQPAQFCRLVRDLFLDMQEESGFILSEKEKPIKWKDYLTCIINPLEISLNEKKLLNRLYEILRKEMVSSDLLMESNQTAAILEKYIVQVLQRVEFELTYSDSVDWQGLLKLMNVQFSEHQDSLIEKLMDYLYVSHELLKIQCFVFVHLLSYLTDYELDKLYEYACYKKINILLLEHNQPEDLSRYAKVVVIDKDICYISLK